MDADIKSLRARYKGLDLNRVVDMIRRGDYGVLADYLQDEGNADAGVNARMVERTLHNLTSDLAEVRDVEARQVRARDDIVCHTVWDFQGTVLDVSRAGSNRVRIYLFNGHSYDLDNDVVVQITRPPSLMRLAEHIVYLRGNP